MAETGTKHDGSEEQPDGTGRAERGGRHARRRRGVAEREEAELTDCLRSWSGERCWAGRRMMMMMKSMRKGVWTEEGSEADGGDRVWW